MRSIIDLACDLITIDSRSPVSNLRLADRIEAELAGFEIERLDYTDAAGTPKRALVASRGTGGFAFSAHMDTVPELGWSRDPWTATVEDGRIYGLGSTDMKGPLAVCITTAQSLPADIPVCLLFSSDEEVTKQGARMIAETSRLARAFAPRGIVVAEPTGLAPLRGHRSHIEFIATARGVQAHSSTGEGVNANWQLVAFLAEMKSLHDRLRTDPTLQDAAYSPPFSDFNLTIDNHGTAVNITVPRATVRIKYRYSASIDPAVVVGLVQAAADRAAIALNVTYHGDPAELPADHKLVRFAERLSGHTAGTGPFGTDAAMLQRLAPCVILGPGDIVDAHTPNESVRVDDLHAGVALFQTLATHTQL